MIERKSSGRGKSWQGLRLDQDQQALAESLLPGAIVVMRAWGRRWPGLESDFLSGAGMAAAMAAATYDPSLGKPIGPWLHQYLLCARKDILRALDPKGYRRQSGEHARTEAPSTGPIEDNLIDGASRDLEAIDIRDQLDRHLEDLPRLQRRIIREAYLEDKTVRQIARSTGLPRDWVGVLLRRAKDRLGIASVSWNTCKQKVKQ